jgi:EmrB/QacA subfamily drug resistance transporter
MIRMAITTSRPPVAPVAERIDYTTILPHQTKLLILGAVLLSLFLAALDQTILGVAIPFIVRDFNGIDLVSWVSTGYLLASTTMVPIYGKLSDMYGRKVILLWGITVFLIGSVLCGISQSMLQLVIYRVVQGIGAAAITSTAFATPADLFVPAERAKYMGIFGGVFGLASVVGPFLGGFLTEQISWHWIFFVNIPLGLVALLFVALKMPRLASGVRAPIDWTGTVLLVATVVPLLLGLTLDKALYPWSSPLIVGLFSMALVSLVLFLIVERRAVSPVLSLSLFRNRTFAAGTAASVCTGAAFFGAVLFLSLYLVNVLGLTATQAGMAQIPLMLGFVLSSNIASQFVQRIGRYKPFIVGGYAIMLVGFVLMTQIGVDSSVYDVSWRIFLLGLGIGPSMPLLSLAMQNAAPPQQIGAVTANRQFFQQLGQAVGAAVFGLVLTTTLTTQLQQNLAPLTQSLPPAARQVLDPSQFRNSAVGTEGGGGEQVDLGAQVATAATAPLEEQRALVQAALGDGDATAREQLLASDMTLPAITAQLEATSGADQVALAQATGALDAEEQRVRAEAESVGTRVNDAVRLSYSISVASIYFYALWLAVIAMIVTVWWLPEIPLSKGRQYQTPSSE